MAFDSSSNKGGTQSVPATSVSNSRDDGGDSVLSSEAHQSSFAPLAVGSFGGGGAMSNMRANPASHVIGGHNGSVDIPSNVINNNNEASYRSSASTDQKEDDDDRFDSASIDESSDPIARSKVEEGEAMISSGTEERARSDDGAEDSGGVLPPEGHRNTDGSEEGGSESHQSENTSVHDVGGLSRRTTNSAHHPSSESCTPLSVGSSSVDQQDGDATTLREGDDEDDEDEDDDVEEDEGAAAADADGRAVSVQQRGMASRTHEGQPGGTLSITLHSMKDEFDEKAEVVVELRNPDLVVEKMLEKLAQKFPPETVVTITPGQTTAPNGTSMGGSASRPALTAYTARGDLSPSSQISFRADGRVVIPHGTLTLISTNDAAAKPTVRSNVTAVTAPDASAIFTSQDGQPIGGVPPNALATFSAPGPILFSVGPDNRITGTSVSVDAEGKTATIENARTTLTFENGSSSTIHQTTAIVGLDRKVTIISSGGSVIPTSGMATCVAPDGTTINVGSDGHLVGRVLIAGRDGQVFILGGPSHDSFSFGSRHSAATTTIHGVSVNTHDLDGAPRSYFGAIVHAGSDGRAIIIGRDGNPISLVDKAVCFSPAGVCLTIGPNGQLYGGNVTISPDERSVTLSNCRTVSASPDGVVKTYDNTTAVILMDGRASVRDFFSRPVTNPNGALTIVALDGVSVVVGPDGTVAGRPLLMSASGQLFCVAGSSSPRVQPSTVQTSSLTTSDADNRLVTSNGVTIVITPQDGQIVAVKPDGLPIQLHGVTYATAIDGTTFTISADHRLTGASATISETDHSMTLDNCRAVIINHNGLAKTIEMVRIRVQNDGRVKLFGANKAAIKVPKVATVTALDGTRMIIGPDGYLTAPIIVAMPSGAPIVIGKSRRSSISAAKDGRSSTVNVATVITPTPNNGVVTYHGATVSIDSDGGAFAVGTDGLPIDLLPGAVVFNPYGTNVTIGRDGRVTGSAITISPDGRTAAISAGTTNIFGNDGWVSTIQNTTTNIGPNGKVEIINQDGQAIAIHGVTSTLAPDGTQIIVDADGYVAGKTVVVGSDGGVFVMGTERPPASTMNAMFEQQITQSAALPLGQTNGLTTDVSTATGGNYGTWTTTTTTSTTVSKPSLAGLMQTNESSPTASAGILQQGVLQHHSMQHGSASPSRRSPTFISGGEWSRTTTTAASQLPSLIPRPAATLYGGISTAIDESGNQTAIHGTSLLLDQEGMAFLFGPDNMPLLGFGVATTAFPDGTTVSIGVDGRVTGREINIGYDGRSAVMPNCRTTIVGEDGQVQVVDDTVVVISQDGRVTVTARNNAVVNIQGMATCVGRDGTTITIGPDGGVTGRTLIVDNQRRVFIMGAERHRTVTFLGTDAPRLLGPILEIRGAIVSMAGSDSRRITVLGAVVTIDRQGNTIVYGPDGRPLPTNESMAICGHDGTAAFVQEGGKISGAAFTWSSRTWDGGVAASHNVTLTIVSGDGSLSAIRMASVLIKGNGSVHITDPNGAPIDNFQAAIITAADGTIVSVGEDGYICGRVLVTDRERNELRCLGGDTHSSTTTVGYEGRCTVLHGCIVTSVGAEQRPTTVHGATIIVCANGKSIMITPSGGPSVLQGPSTSISAADGTTASVSFGNVLSGLHFSVQADGRTLTAEKCRASLLNADRSVTSIDDTRITIAGGRVQVTEVNGTPLPVSSPVMTVESSDGTIIPISAGGWVVGKVLLRANDGSMHLIGSELSGISSTVGKNGRVTRIFQGVTVAIEGRNSEVLRDSETVVLPGGAVEVRRRDGSKVAINGYAWAMATDGTLLEIPNGQLLGRALPGLPFSREPLLTRRLDGFTTFLTTSSTSSLPSASPLTANQTTTTTTSTSYEPRVYTTSPTHSQRLDHGGHSVLSSSVVSSRIVSDSRADVSAVEETVTVIEVPVTEERVKEVTRQEYIEVERRVPKYEYEYLEKTLEIPQIHYVETLVEVPQIVTSIREVRKKEIVEVPREIIRTVPKIETKIIEQEVEVPGPVIEVPKTHTVNQTVVVPSFTDQEVPFLVAQKLVPTIRESGDVYEVDVRQYEPRMVPVDVYVPIPVAVPIIAHGVVGTSHKVVSIPAAQFNSAVSHLNRHLESSQHPDFMPYAKSLDGMVPMLPVGERIELVTPLAEDWRETKVAGAIYCDLNGGFQIATAAMLTAQVRSAKLKHASDLAATNSGAFIGNTAITSDRNSTIVGFSGGNDTTVKSVHLNKFSSESIRPQNVYNGATHVNVSPGMSHHGYTSPATGLGGFDSSSGILQQLLNQSGGGSKTQYQQRVSPVFHRSATPSQVQSAFSRSAQMQEMTNHVTSAPPPGSRYVRSTSGRLMLLTDEELQQRLQKQGSTSRPAPAVPIY